METSSEIVSNSIHQLPALPHTLPEAPMLEIYASVYNFIQ